MAFNVLNFNCARHSASPSSNGYNNTQNFYTSLGDTLSDILTPGYFTAYFSFAPNLSPQNNDTIKIVASDGVGEALITDNTTGTVSQISSPPVLTSQILTNQTVSLSGIWASSQTAILQMVRNIYSTGYIETTLNLPAVLANATTPGTVSMTPIPTYYPLFGASAITMPPITVQDNGARKVVNMFFDNSVLSIENSFSGLSNIDTSGIYPISITYPSN